MLTWPVSSTGKWGKCPCLWVCDLKQIIPDKKTLLHLALTEHPWDRGWKGAYYMAGFGLHSASPSASSLSALHFGCWSELPPGLWCWGGGCWALAGINTFQEADTQQPHAEHPKSPAAHQNFISCFSMPISRTSTMALSSSPGETGDACRRAGRTAKFGDRAPPRGSDLQSHLPEAFVGWLMSPSRVLCPTWYLLPHVLV